MNLSDRIWLVRSLARKHGLPRALVKQFRPQFARAWSRGLIERFAPSGQGLEIGVGAQTIAPVKRTLLTDGHASHAGDGSLATEFFPADAIPRADDTFQFVLSEHVLEHVPNVLKTLREWKRVLKPGGVVICFMPDPTRTFDRARELTPLSHLIDDERRGVGAMEDAHYDEWMEKVVEMGLAPHYSGQTKEECLRTCSLHRHVWNALTLAQVFEHAGFRVLFSESLVPDRTDSFVVIGEKI